MTKPTSSMPIANSTRPNGRSFDSSIAATRRARPRSRRSPRARAAARPSGGRSRRRWSRARPAGAGPTCFSPRPSMSIAPRETKCLSSCHWRPGQTRFGHFVKTPPSGLTVGVSHDGQCAGGRGGSARSGRSTACGAGETTCGMTSPARRTMTSSPTRRSLRARSSSLCSVASLTVTPPTCDGLEHRERVQVAELADVPHDVAERRDLRRRRELPGDRPARVAPDDAEAALQLEVVRPSRRRRRSRSPGAPRRSCQRRHCATTSSSVVEPHDVAVDAEAVLAQPLQRLPVAREARRPSVRPIAVGPHRQRPLARRAPGRAGGSSRRRRCAGS